MRKPIVILVLFAFVLIAVSSVALAQDGADPHNPCLNGTWYCPDSDDAAREQWNWTCAWYMSHHAAGEISAAQVPEWCVPVTCQIEFTDYVVAEVGLSSPFVDIALSVVNGLVDPDAPIGASPYGFDWVGTMLYIYGPTGGGPIWDTRRGWWDGTIILSHTCPEPTPPAGAPPQPPPT